MRLPASNSRLLAMGSLVVLLSLSSLTTAGEGEDPLPWAFHPLVRPSVPKFGQSERREWIETPIDAFVLAKLEAAGVDPSPEAGRRTLIRRASFDLLGIPPTFEEVEAFVHDDRPGAWERLVDRLLASPLYGERWGRHWLDVARYADTKDLVLVYGRDAIRPYAYTYRDWAVRAFNEDVPYDELILDQLAADKRWGTGKTKVKPDETTSGDAHEDERWRLAAMGFLTLGRLFDYNQHDIRDDRIDTVTRGFLALTVSCARCHDHKYDPISMEDYYSLYGIFASSVKPLEAPKIGAEADSPDLSPAARECEASLEEKRRELRDLIDTQYEAITSAARAHVTDYLVHVATTEPDPLENVVFFLSLSPDQLHPQVIARWRRFIAQRATSNDPIFGPWHDFLAVSEVELPERGREIVANWLARDRGLEPGEIHPRIASALEATVPKTRAEIGRLWGHILQEIDEKAAASGDFTAASAALAATDRALVEIVRGRGSPLWFPKSDTYLYMSRVPRTRFHGLELEIDKIAVQSPALLPRAMVLVDSEEPVEPRVFLRGNPTQPGEPVPRRFLSALGGKDSEPFTEGSGRLELARAIASDRNPLTARVIVNRVWMHHFGEPLVSTPSDFGMRSDPPTHPELLDWLATELIRDDWSLKGLHREILLSKAWKQSSADRPECRRIDPENKLLWRARRRRLELEPYRDTLLAVSGRLDRTIGGRPVDAAGDPECRRRTVYGLIDRQDVPSIYRALDFPSPDQSVARRPQTIVPQAALFALNSPFMAVQARSLAARPEVTSAETDSERVRALYRIIFARDANRDELALGVDYVTTESAATRESDEPEGSLSPWEKYAQALLLTSELQYVD